MSPKNKQTGFQNLLKKLDYFAITFQFRINNHKKYGSSTGGIIFCIYLFFSIFYFFTRFMEYISWEERKLLFIDKSPEKSPILNLKNLGMEYAVSINFDNETSIFDSKYSNLFEIEHRYVFINNTLNSSKTSKTLGKTRDCNKNDFNQKIDNKSAIHKNKLLFKCFDLEDRFNLEGIYTDNIFSYIEIFLKLNKNYFKNFTDLEQIFKENQFKYTIYYTDNFLDIGQSYDNSNSTQVEAIYTYINLQYYERINIFLQEIEYCTDINLFYKNFKCNEFHKFYKYENKMGPLPNRMYLPEENRYSISKFILRAESTTKQIMVSYIKISEFLSNVLALLVNALVVLSMIIIPINEMKARQTINEKVMKVKDIIKLENKHLLEYFSENFRINKNFNGLSNNNNSLTSEKLFTNERFSSRVNLNNEIPKYPKKKDDKRKTSFDSKKKNTTQRPMLNLNENSNISNCPKLNWKKNNIGEISKYDLSSSDRIKITPDHNLIEINLRDIRIINNPSNLKNDNKNTINENIYKNKIDSSYFGKLNENIEEMKQNNNRLLGNEIEWLKDLQKTVIPKRKNPFKIRIKDLLKYLFRCQKLSKKFEINNIADLKFNKTIDIVNYITKMNEIDILKYLILDEDLVEIVDFLSKPHISSSDINKKNKIFEMFFKSKLENASYVKDNLSNIKSIFDKVMKKENPNIFGLKLMKLFDYEIKNLKD